MADHPQRIQLSRAKGWRLPPDTLKVDRSTRWGNPFKSSEHSMSGQAEIRLANGMAQLVDDWWSAQTTVELFEAWIQGRPVLNPAYLDGRLLAHPKTLPPRPDLSPLRGKHLACWCRIGQPCHADVLLRLAHAPA